MNNMFDQCWHHIGILFEIIWLGKDEGGDRRTVAKPVTKGIPLDPRTDVREGEGQAGR